MKSIGDRIKENYENRARYELTRRIPVIIRIDGRAFHTFTRGMNRPFDQKLIDAMVESARVVANSVQGCKAAYVQSDEASFLVTDYDTLQTDAWFGYNKSKVESISASIMTASFNRIMSIGTDAYFDSRSFNVPREEVSNYFLWRALDWERNSLTMYAGSFFSHKQLHGMNSADKHEMLHEIGKNWTTDLTSQQRNGTFIISGEVRTDILPTYDQIDSVLSNLVYCDKVVENERRTQE